MTSIIQRIKFWAIVGVLLVFIPKIYLWSVFGVLATGMIYFGWIRITNLLSKF